VDDGKTCEGYVMFARATYKTSKTWAALSLEQRGMMVTLIMMANHKDAEWWDGKQFITIHRGEFVTSLDSLNKIFGKSSTIRKIRTLLSNLKKMEFLTNRTTNKYRLITVANYDFYQLPNNYATSKTTSRRQAGDKQATTNKNVKNVKNDKEEDLFARFYAAYPKKKAPADALKAWEQIGGQNRLDEILAAIEKQRTSPEWIKDGGQYIPYPATWLRKQRWEDGTTVTENTERRPLHV
jgi:hypothetical protein